MITRVITILLFVLTLTGCGSSGSGSVVLPEDPPVVLNLKGRVDLQNIKFPTSICGNNDYQFRDLSVFDLSVQDSKETNYVSSNGNFSFGEIAPREQMVVFCTYKNNKNLVFEWMGANSAALNGEKDITIDVFSTARSFIARTLRDRHGKRVKPEAIEDKYITPVVNAIVQTIENTPDELTYLPLSKISVIKESYTQMADSLAEKSGIYPLEQVFLFYFAGDNDLSSCLENSLKTIAEAGQPTDCEILAFIDTAGVLPNLNKAGAGIFRVVKKELRLIKDLGNVDSSDCRNIQSLIEYAFRNYPAKGYSLFLEGHGNTWEGSSRILGNARATILSDASESKDGTVIDFATGIGFALNNLNATNRRFEVLVLDLCLMGNIESIYEFGDFANYTLCSEALVPGEGIPYGNFMKEVALLGIKTLSARDKAIILCNCFSEKYLSNPNNSYGISLIDNSYLPTFVALCKDYFTVIYNNSVEYCPLIYNIRTATTISDGDIASGSLIQNFGEDFVDFKQLVFECRANLPKACMEADRLLGDGSGFSRLILYSNYSKNLRNANGISITLPLKDKYNSNYRGINPASEYFNLKFCHETLWEQLLDRY